MKTVLPGVMSTPGTSFRFTIGLIFGSASPFEAAAAQTYGPTPTPQSPPLTLEPVEVTGTRIRTLLGEQEVQPVISISRPEIDRYGVTSVGELFEHIPQVTAHATGQIATNTAFLPFAGVNSTQVTAMLRGVTDGGTLLLINGQRVPKTGQALSSGAILNAAGTTTGYDLSGVPLAAIERIEVLLDGASAVYGADAVGGVINVILKSNYRGSEIRLGYENTFSTDVSTRSVSITHGFAAGKLHGYLTASYDSSSQMYWRDRWFLQTMDRRGLGGSDQRNPNVIGGPGVLRALSGTLRDVNRTIVGIPIGADGSTAAIAEFAAASVPEPLDVGRTAPWNAAIQRRNITGKLEYGRGALTAFADFRYGKSASTTPNSTPLQAFNITLPAGAAGNPFNSFVSLSKVFYDLPTPTNTNRTTNLAFTTGIRGRLSADWRYRVTAAFVRSRSFLEATSGTAVTNAPTAAALRSANPPVLVYDSTTIRAPNPPGTIEALAPPVLGGENTDTWTYAAELSGAYFSLPAGRIRMAAGIEYREEYAGFPFSTASLGRPRSFVRDVAGYHAEVRIPIIAEQQNWKGVHGLEYSASVRFDHYEEFPDRANTRYGILYRPFRSLMLRGSVGEGYRLPSLTQLYQPSTTGSVTISASAGVIDPARGNLPILGTLPSTRIGNPELRPERSRHTTTGLVFNVPNMKGLSLSADYVDTQHLDLAGVIPLADQIVLFPDEVVRGPNLPNDPPDWPGPVARVDQRPINLAERRIVGVDYGIKFSRKTRWGEWNLTSRANRTTRVEVRTAPGLPLTRASTPDAYPLRMNSSLFWTNGRFEVGALTTYRAKSRITTAQTVFSPSTIRWDARISYTFGAATNSLDLRAIAEKKPRLNGRLGLTIFNVLNTKPPIVGGSLTTGVVDARLRRYALTLTEKF